MAIQDTHHVVPNPNGGCDVKRGGGQKASHHTDTKAEAEIIERGISKNQKPNWLFMEKMGRYKVKTHMAMILILPKVSQVN